MTYKHKKQKNQMMKDEYKEDNSGRVKGRREELKRRKCGNN
jgi:hypothetical protein